MFLEYTHTKNIFYRTQNTEPQILQIVEETTRHEKDGEADEFKDTMKRKVGKHGEHPFAIDFFIIKQQYNGDTQNANGGKLRLVGSGQEAVVVQ